MTDTYSSSRRKLANYEQTGRYVFHGSGTQQEILTPRQAYDFQSGIKQPDGEPAIFASDKIAIPIFMAIFNQHNMAVLSTSCGYDNQGGLHLEASKDTLENIPQNASGYVYVCNKQDFIEHRGHEWIATKKVRPVDVVAVSLVDIQEHIDIM